MIQHIPLELRAAHQWVVWKSIPNPNGAKPIKLPINARTLNPASVTDPSTWSTFLTAHRTLQNNSQLSGSGFVLTKSDPFVGVDLDNCLFDTIKPEAEEYIKLLDSYTEVSPLHHGLHSWCKGELPPGGRKHGWVEMYDCERFLCMTGEIYGDPKGIAERTRQLAELHLKAIELPQYSYDPSGGSRHDAVRDRIWYMANHGYSQEEAEQYVHRFLMTTKLWNRENEFLRLVDGAYQKNISVPVTIQVATEHFYDASNLNWNIPEVDWLIPGLMPKENLIWLAGQSQTGKSIFMGYTAIALACGAPFSIFKGIRKSKVAYLVLEDSRSRINARTAKFQQDLGAIPDEGQLTFMFAYNFSLTNERISKLMKYIEKNNMDVIVIDTYQRATPGMTSYADEKQSVIIQSLAKVVRNTGCTIICIDHLRKLDERSKHYKKGLNLDDVKGSGAKVANSDTVILMDRFENKLFLNIFSKDLDGDCEYVLDYNSQPKYMLTQD